MTFWEKAREILMDAILVALLVAVVVISMQVVETLDAWQRAALESLK